MSGEGRGRGEMPREPANGIPGRPPAIGRDAANPSYAASGGKEPR